MTDNAQNKSSISFEINEELINKNSRTLKTILEKNKEIFLYAENFDSSVQNLTLLENIIKKGNSSYLAKLEKKDISIKELVNTINSKEEDFLVLNALYITCNYIYYSNINRNKSSFSEEYLENLRLDLEERFFINSKFNKMPNFPFLKLWLSQINHYFNFNNKTDFFKNINNLQKIQLIIKNFGKEENNKEEASHSFFNVSLIYGANFFNLSHMEQNNFSKDELEIIFLILNLIKDMLFVDKTSFETKLKRFKQKIKDFKENKNLIDYKDSLRNSISNDNIPILPKTNKNFEKRVFDKLIAHLENLIVFFDIYNLIFFFRDHKKALTQIFESAYNSKKKKFKSMYSLSYYNLLGIINFRENNLIMANNCFSKGIAELDKTVEAEKEENEDILQIKKNNNLKQQNFLHYNVAMCHYKLNDFDKCVKILNSLQHQFKKNHIFWYRLGICNYQLFKQEISKLSETLFAKHKSFIHEDKKKYAFSNLKFYTLYCQNVMEEFLGQKKKTKKVEGKENKNSKMTNLDKSIFAFFNCFLLIKNVENENNLRSNFDSLKKKKIDVLIKNHTKNVKEMEKYLYSSLEHLIFLLIVSKQELKAKFYLNEIMAIKTLTEKQKNKLLIYHSIIAAKLSDYEKSLECLDKLNMNNNQDLKKKIICCNFFLGKENNFSENLFDISNYNKLLIYYLKKDNEAFVKKLTSSEIRDKIFDLNDQGDPKIYEKLLFWSFYSTRDFSVNQIKSVVHSVYPQENIF